TVGLDAVGHVDDGRGRGRIVGVVEEDGEGGRDIDTFLIIVYNSFAAGVHECRLAIGEEYEVLVLLGRFGALDGFLGGLETKSDVRPLPDISAVSIGIVLRSGTLGGIGQIPAAVVL